MEQLEETVMASKVQATSFARYLALASVGAFALTATAALRKAKQLYHFGNSVAFVFFETCPCRDCLRYRQHSQAISATYRAN